MQRKAAWDETTLGRQQEDPQKRAAPSYIYILMRQRLIVTPVEESRLTGTGAARTWGERSERIVFYVL